MSCLVAFHDKSYGTFLILKKPYNLHSSLTHYRNYRAGKGNENLGFKAPKSKSISLDVFDHLLVASSLAFEFGIRLLQGMCDVSFGY